MMDGAGKQGSEESSGSAPPVFRRLAEKTLAERKADEGDVSRGTTPTPEKLIHESRVHQIELEMQNEALRDARLSLEESRDGTPTCTSLPRSGISPCQKMPLSRRGTSPAPLFSGLTGRI